MKISSTNEDLSKSQFVQSLYRSLRQQTKNAISDHKKWMAKTAIFIQDGLDSEECEELLVIEGLSRAAAKNYVEMVQSDVEKGGGLNEYSFQFEDAYGTVLGSYDVGKKIFASNENEAWEKSEEVVGNLDSNSELRLISVEKVD